MRYTIQNLSHTVHDLDDNIVIFHFDIHFTEPENLVVKKYFLDYSMVASYIGQKHPDFYNYLKSVHSSIDHWGPCEDKLFEEMGEEALQQLYGFAEEYLLQADWVPELYGREKKFRSETPQKKAEVQQQAKKVVADLGSGKESMKAAQRKYYLFCETVEKQIRQTAAEVYPELVDGDAEQLKEFKYMFVSDIQAMYSKIEKMRAKYKK